MTDHFFSLFDNYKSKIRNPFIGTILSVWIIRNWKVVYALFNFDKDRTMDCKINYIESYFSKIIFWSELINCFLIALLTLVITFILLFISRSITDFYYKVAEPYIITKIDKKAIFTITDKENLEHRITSLIEKLDNQKDAYSKSEKNNELLQLKLNEDERINSNKLTELSEKGNEYLIKNQNLALELNGVKNITEQYNLFLRRLPSGALSILINLQTNGTYTPDGRNVYVKDQLIKLLDIGLIKFKPNSNDSYILSQSGILFMNIHSLNIQE